MKNREELKALVEEIKDFIYVNESDGYVKKDDDGNEVKKDGQLVIIGKRKLYSWKDTNKKNRHLEIMKKIYIRFHKEKEVISTCDIANFKAACTAFIKQQNQDNFKKAYTAFQKRETKQPSQYLWKAEMAQYYAALFPENQAYSESEKMIILKGVKQAYFSEWEEEDDVVITDKNITAKMWKLINKNKEQVEKNRKEKAKKKQEKEKAKEEKREERKKAKAEKAKKGKTSNRKTKGTASQSSPKRRKRS